jgi:DNA-3-methyladenine glycosylase II
VTAPVATGRLTAVPPFDWAQSLRFLSGFQPAAGEHLLAAQSLTKAVCVAGQAVAFRVTAAGSVEQPALDYELFAERAVDVTAVVDRLRFFLSLDDDLRPFYALAEQDTAFAPILRRLYGYHQVKFLTPFESAVWAVLSQRNPIPQARRMKQALIDTYGQAVEVEGQTHWAFPEPRLLAAASPADLAAVISHKQKAGYLAAVAAAFGRREEAWLRTADYEAVEGWLREIRGIGAWSAAFILLRGLGRMERLPVDEKWLAEAAARVYTGGRPLAPGQLQALAEPYGPYQGYWAHYLRAAG